MSLECIYCFCSNDSKFVDVFIKFKICFANTIFLFSHGCFQTVIGGLPGAPYSLEKPLVHLCNKNISLPPDVCQKNAYHFFKAAFLNSTDFFDSFKGAICVFSDDERRVVYSNSNCSVNNMSICFCFTTNQIHFLLCCILLSVVREHFVIVSVLYSQGSQTGGAGTEQRRTLQQLSALSRQGLFLLTAQKGCVI